MTKRVQVIFRCVFKGILAYLVSGPLKITKNENIKNLPNMAFLVKNGIIWKNHTKTSTSPEKSRPDRIFDEH
jgi:hypothetical protein